ncbi:MAG TPA: hypothetical protein PKK70_03410 [Candidatus Paceibacterota bacterium]|nr:hypothetical protein [Candidatus Paceibacterota bacterium]
MNHSNLIASIKDIFIIAKTLSDTNCKLECKREFETDQRFQLGYFFNLYPNQSTLFCGITIYLNTKTLWEEYLKLPGKKVYTEDFTKNNDVMYSLIHRRYIEIISNLKDYNGTNDNYTEIAKLIDPNRGRALSKKLDIL